MNAHVCNASMYNAYMFKQCIQSPLLQLSPETACTVHLSENLSFYKPTVCLLELPLWSPPNTICSRWCLLCLRLRNVTLWTTLTSSSITVVEFNCTELAWCWFGCVKLQRGLDFRASHGDLALLCPFNLLCYVMLSTFMVQMKQEDTPDWKALLEHWYTSTWKRQNKDER